MILFRHIIREHLLPFLYSLGILVFIFILQYAIQILNQIISRGLDAGVVLEIFVINLGWIIALAVPAAVLAATLMAFGRMSADNEIVAVKASGLNLYHLLTPVLSAAALFCVLLIYFNNLILPDANHRTANLMSAVSRKKPAAFIEPDVLIKDFEHYAIHVKDVDGRTGKLWGIKIFSEVPGEGPSTTLADSGVIRQTPDGGHLRLTLHHGETHTVGTENEEDYFVARFDRQVLFIKNVDSELRRDDSGHRGDREKSSTMMLEDIKEFRASRKRHIDTYHALIDSFTAYITDLDTMAPAAGAGEDSTGPAGAVSFEEWLRTVPTPPSAGVEQLTGEIRTLERLVRRARSKKKQVSKYLVEVHKKFAIPVACIVFVLVGAPLGIMARRGGIAVGASYSVFFFILYWAFLIKGENMADRLVISPFTAMWTGNILIGVCGIILIARMVRETTFISYGWLFRLGRAVTDSAQQRRGWRLVRMLLGLPGRIATAPLVLFRYLTGILPVYVLRIFVGYLLGLLAALVVVFVVVDYVSNTRRFADVPLADVGLFYWYYLPWIVQIMVPIVLLLASMFAIGQLAKNSELVAVKAAGRSIRRVTMPLLILGLLLAGLSFYFGERVLPRANMQRRELLEQIKHGGRKAKGAPSREFRRNFYYFGNENTVYCFREFRTRPLKTKSVWRESLVDNRIVQRVQARESIYRDGEWYFVDGMIRRFRGDSFSVTAFDTLPDRVLRMKPEEMVVRIKSPEEMSYWELNDFIEKSRRQGENVQQYLADLHFKIAYPFMNFIVILLGISITARTGRSGGAVLFGIGLLLVFSYWIFSQFTLTLGKNDHLSPMTGAWLGNVVFLFLGAALYRKVDR